MKYTFLNVLLGRQLVYSVERWFLETWSCKQLRTLLFRVMSEDNERARKDHSALYERICELYKAEAGVIIVVLRSR